MNIVICETSDSKIWNVGNFVSALANASRQGAVIVDMNAEGPCLTSINFEQIVSSISGLNIDHIRTSNQVVSSGLNEVRTPLVELELTKSKLEKFQPVVSTLSHKFGIFIGRSNWFRLGLASFLYQYYGDSTWFLYHYDNSDDYHRANFGLEALLQKQWRMKQSVFDFIQQLPIKSDNLSYPILWNSGALDLQQPYQSIFCEIVCETYFTGKTFMMTEKIMRPIMQRRPFVVQGPKHYLDNLRLLGFKTFDAWWDESYTQDDTDGQFSSIIWTLNYIGKQSDQTLKTWYEEMQPTLEHNAQILSRLTNEQIIKTSFKS